ncbi:MAG: sodium:proton antiporter [Actinomycetota bacterium]
MTFETVLVLAAIVFGYGLVSSALGRRSISGPLVFTVAGVLIGPSSLGLIDGSFAEGGVEVLAEATLVLVLFSDATRIDLRALRSQTTLPLRLLGIGLPLTVGLGTVVAVLLFDGLTWWEGALIAAILAPTDAALGQAVVSNPRVPVRVRQALNVESGLNDGLMLPAITILIAAAAAESGIDSTGQWVRFVAEQIGFGVGLGVLIGWCGGLALDRVVARGWVDSIMRQLATLAVAVAAFSAAELTGGNGFVAAFVAGMAFGYAAEERGESAADFTEDEGQLLALLTFAFFGALLLGPRLGDLSVEVALYAVLSLTVIRMVPVALAMLGVGLEWPTVGYLGWFGPRGLASILFGLSVVEEVELAGSETILEVMTWTVLASIVAHGLTAVPFANRYADWFAAMDDDDMAAMPEAEEVAEMRPRQRHAGDEGPGPTAA